MRKNNVQVHRGEVNVQLGNGDDEEAEGYAEGNFKAYNFPDPQSLAIKYGLKNGNSPACKIFTYLSIDSVPTIPAD